MLVTRWAGREAKGVGSQAHAYRFSSPKSSIIAAQLLLLRLATSPKSTPNAQHLLSTRKRCLDNHTHRPVRVPAPYLLCRLPTAPLRRLAQFAAAQPSAWLLDLRGTQSHSPLDSSAPTTPLCSSYANRDFLACLYTSPLLDLIIIATPHPPPASCEDPPDPYSGEHRWTAA